MNKIFEYIRQLQQRRFAQATGLHLHNDWTWCARHMMHVFMPINVFYKGYKTVR